MRIILVYFAIDANPKKPTIFDYYSYGLGYISSVLKTTNKVNYVTLKTNDDILKLYREVKVAEPQLIGFSATTSQISHVKKVASNIRKISNCFIVCGGVHVTLNPECIYEIPELDAIIRGEGEISICELANALKNNDSYLSIKNLWVRHQGKIIKNRIRPLIENIDELPFPDKDTINYQKIINNLSGKNRFIFSRGCTYDCSYCSNKALSNLYQNNRKYFRQRSPQKAIKEIELDEKKYKFKKIIFDDDTITINKKWFFEFFNLYERKFKYPFECNLRIGTFDSKMIKVLKKAGMIQANIGIEHGNEKFREKILNRKMSNKMIINAANMLKKYKIKITMFIMVGFPYENKKLFLDTVKLARKISRNSYLSIFHPYPGTKLGKICFKKKWLPEADAFWERRQAVIDYPNFKKQEIQLCYNTFNLLTNNKFIPLFLPLELIWKSALFLKKISSIINKLK